MRDRLRLDGAAALDRASGLRGLPITATLWAAPAGAALLEAVRELPGVDGLHAGATLLDDLLVVRLLGADAEPLRRRCVEIWQRPVVVLDIR